MTVMKYFITTKIWRGVTVMNIREIYISDVGIVEKSKKVGVFTMMDSISRARRVFGVIFSLLPSASAKIPAHTGFCRSHKHAPKDGSCVVLVKSKTRSVEFIVDRTFSIKVEKREGRVAGARGQEF